MAALHFNEGPAIIDSCKFIANQSNGEGVVSLHRMTSLVSNCVFVGNTTGFGAGVIQLTGIGDATVLNTTIAGNVSENGSAIADAAFIGFFFTGPLHVTNSVVWGNQSSLGLPFPPPIDAIGVKPMVRHSCVQNPSDELVAEYVIDADPRFRNPPGEDGVAGTEDDDYRLTAGSPCVDAGDNAALGAEDLFDLDGRVRRIDSPLVDDVGVGKGPIADMGAFEFQAGDVNDDFVVSLADFEGWKACVAESGGPNCLMLDFDGDGDVDLVDWSGLQLALDRGE